LNVLRTIGALLGLALCTALPAKATTLDYAFKFTGAFSGSGDILVIKDHGGYDIQGIAGSISGPTSGAITKLLGTPNVMGAVYTDLSSNKQWIYDDVLHTSGVPFDYFGVLFGFGKNYVGNIYSINTQLFLSVSQAGGGLFDPGAPIRLTVSQTPLPAALPMFLTGLGGLWFAMRRRNKKAADNGLELEQLAAA
jgi:hypothetical protein